RVGGGTRAVAVVILLAGAAEARAQYSWNVNADGNWSVAANWTGAAGIPNAAGATATLGPVIPQPRARTVHPAGPPRAPPLAPSAGYGVTLGTGGSLTFNNLASNSVIQDQGSGSVLATDLTVAGNNSLDLSETAPAGSLNVTGAITASGGTVRVTGGV